MRIITSYAYTLDVETAEEAVSRFRIYRSIMDDWLRDRGVSDPRSDSPIDTFIQLERRDVSHEGAEIDGFLLKQPVLESSHLLHTRFDLAVAGESLALFLQFRLERRTTRIAPVSYPVSCPRALQSILDAGAWKSGQARVRPHSRRLFGREAGTKLRTEIKDPDRTLPIVLLANFRGNKPLGDYQELSEPYGEDEWEDFVNRIEDELGGVALIAELDEASEDSLLPRAPHNLVDSDLKDRARRRPVLLAPRRDHGMCGAVVRIVWPLGREDFVPDRHPAWAPYELFAHPDSGIFYNDHGDSTDPPGWMGTFERDQLMLLRRFVRDKIYEQAALQPVPELIDNVRRRYAIAERERITASGDLDALEELHQEEIAEKDETIGSLRESLTRRDSAFVELQDKLDQKQAKLAHLQYQLGQAKGEPGADDRVEEATESRLPATVAEAIEISKNRFPALRFGPQSMDKLESLNPQAGPPRKILGDLDTLNQLSQLLKGDSKLGQDVISWLKAQNVNVSRESSTRLNKYAAELTFPTVRGTYEQMGHHIKYGGGLGKDIEARIHFSVHLSDDEDGVTIDVGYVGPKIMPD